MGKVTKIHLVNSNSIVFEFYGNQRITLISLFPFSLDKGRTKNRASCEAEDTLFAFISSRKFPMLAQRLSFSHRDGVRQRGTSKAFH